MHGVGQPPFVGTDFSSMVYLREAHIPFSRLHDVGGAYGGNLYADIPNLFRDFDADPEDPGAYDFAFTDLLVTALMENGTEPFFRLGVTIENHCAIKAYRIYPPRDPLKWARICEGVIRHYTQGWANGFCYPIRYWEIWNEPDNEPDPSKNPMWQGTKEEYYELYRVAATYLKARFPHLKFGGYASCGFYALFDQNPFANSSSRLDYFITFLDGFLDSVKRHRTPFDFFSWHSYDDVHKNQVYARYARQRLDEAGFTQVETVCNEWNAFPDQRGTLFHAAQNTAMLIAFQQSCLDSAMFYDARIGLSIYGGLFDPMRKTPYPLYYGFKNFGRLYALGSEIATASDTQTLWVCGASNGTAGGLLLVNLGPAEPITLSLAGGRIKSCRLTDSGHTDWECPVPDVLPENGILYLQLEHAPCKTV